MLTNDLVAAYVARRRKPDQWLGVSLAFLVALLGIAATIGTIDVRPLVVWSLCSAFITMVVYERDQKQRNIYLGYDESVRTDPLFISLCEAFQGMASSRKFWVITTFTAITSRGRSAGAGYRVGRHKLRLMTGVPKCMTSNLKAPLIVGHTALYFFPDAVLMGQANHWRRVPYDQIWLSAGCARFIEEGKLPEDAPVEGGAWQVVNVKGYPDKRVKHNRLLPVARYDCLTISCEGVPDTILYLSRPGSAQKFVAAFEQLRRGWIVQGLPRDETTVAQWF